MFVATDYYTARSRAEISTSSSPTFRVMQEPGAYEDDTLKTNLGDVEEETPNSIVCPQDVVCIALDVSGSMRVRKFII